jgi:acetyltransferase
MKSDPLFGPVLLLGEGGVAVELRQRHALSLPPLNAPLAQRWLDRSGVMPLLAGFRGHAPADLAALIEVLLKVSQLATDLSDIVELDLNPLLVDDSGVIAVDARVRLRPLDQAAVPPAILPYPAELEELWGQGGQTLLLRPIRPEDGTALQQFYAQASAEDLRLRFFAARREVPLSELARYSQIDYDREMTFVALPTAPGQAKRLLGQVRAVCDPDQVQAEFAIEVAGDYQGRGLGSALLRKLMAYLRQRGVKVLTGLCLTENQAMLGLARSLGFALTSDTAQGQVQFRLTL